MLDIKFIRGNKDLVKENASKRGMRVDIDKLLALDERRRELIGEIEALRAQQNLVSSEISKEKDDNQRNEKINKMKGVKERLGWLEPEFKKTDQEFNDLLLAIPNILQTDVPSGKSEADNVILRQVGKKPKFGFKPRDYIEIGKQLDLIDTERAAKVSGSRFGYIKNELAILEFALVALAFDKLSKEGFKPAVPPVMIKTESMKAMGYIDTQEDQKERYFFPEDDLYLVGTSEQSIGPMHMKETFAEKDLPLRYVAFSTCFRREAGSYGKDTKGILRVHQFDKVEMFSFTKSEDSLKEHKFLLAMEEKLMQALQLPYRVVALCSADLARPSSATYDIETWLPSAQQYRETHSTSNCTDFQSRRLDIKYKNSKTGKPEFVHMLNGTAFAIGRTLISILENCQQKDGSVEVPKVLRDWCGFKKIKSRE